MLNSFQRGQEVDHPSFASGQHITGKFMLVSSENDSFYVSRSFATGPVDSPPRRINTRPVSKGLHYKGVLDDRVRASSTIGQQRGEASHGVHGGHGGEKCSFGLLIMHLINLLVREAAPRQLHAENASPFRFNSYCLPP